MTDDERVHDLLTRAAVPPRGPLAAPVPQLLERAHRQRRLRQGALMAVVAAATVVAIVVPSVLAGGSRHGTGPAGHRTSPPSPQPTSTAYPSTGPGSALALAASHWSTLPPAPIPGRDNAMSVWTGSRWLIWGGGIGNSAVTMRADGAAYDPATKTWATLPASPLTGRSDAASVWTGHDMFLWGGYDQLDAPHAHATADGALYDPETRTWRVLPASPLSPRVDATALWTGREVIVTGGQPAQATAMDQAVTDAAAYDPATNKWHRIASPPFPHGVQVQFTTAIAAGGAVDEWVSWDRSLKLDGRTTGERVGITLDRYSTSTGRWTAVSATGDIPAGVHEPAWTGSEILMPAAYNCPSSCPAIFGTYGWRYDVVSKRWTAIAHGPGDLHDSDSVWTGKALLGYDTDAFIGGGGRTKTVRPGDAEAWAPDTDRWYSVPRAPYVGDQSDVSVWTGSQLLIWGQMSRATRHQNSRAPLHTVGLSLG